MNAYKKISPSASPDNTKTKISPTLKSATSPGRRIGSTSKERRVHVSVLLVLALLALALVVGVVHYGTGVVVLVVGAVVPFVVS